jgi:hypothetical protein
MTIFGYARVSTNGQNLAAQEAELMAAGCAKVFKEKVSGAKTDRAEVAKLIGKLAPGDVLVVTRLDRLARSTRDLLNVLATIAERQAGQGHMGRHHHSTRQADANRARRLGRVRARAYPCPYRRRQEACEGPWRQVWTANCTDTAPTAGSNPAPCEWRSAG